MLASLLNMAIRTLGGTLVDKLVQGLIATLTNWAIERAIKGMDSNVETHDLERYYLLKKVRGAETNEERQILSIVLARLVRGELSNSDGETNSDI